MPYKHNVKRKHKFTKSQYKVINWPKYNATLCMRGSITFWFSQDVIDGWLEPKENYNGLDRQKLILILQFKQL